MRMSTIRWPSEASGSGWRRGDGLFVLPAGDAPATRRHPPAADTGLRRDASPPVPAARGTEFFGVREYHPGDPPHSINWRASARSMEALYSNEYQQERVADVGIVVDGRLEDQ